MFRKCSYKKTVISINPKVPASKATLSAHTLLTIVFIQNAFRQMIGRAAILPSTYPAFFDDFGL